MNFFAVVSIKQRFPGHARQAAYMTAQCQAAAGHLGRYVVVVDDDIDPSNLADVVWAMGTRTNWKRTSICCAIRTRAPSTRYILRAHGNSLARGQSSMRAALRLDRGFS